MLQSDLPLVDRYQFSSLLVYRMDFFSFSIPVTGLQVWGWGEEGILPVIRRWVWRRSEGVEYL